MSINKLISIDNIVLNATISLGLDHNKYKPMFVNWAIAAEKQIGSFYQYQRKIAVLNITNCVADLPCEATFLELALLGDYGCDCGDLFKRVCVGGNLSITSSLDTSLGFLIVDLPSDYQSGFLNYVDYDVQDNKLILSRNCDAQKITVQYLGIITDENGIPKVGENHMEAIEEYCMWKFRSRRIRSGIDLGLARDHERRWHSLCAAARGDDGQLNESNQQNISNILHNPISGRGLPLTGWDNL